MVPSQAPETSLRLGRRETSRLAWALCISLLVHLFCFGTYEVGKKTQLWRILPEWLQRIKMVSALLHPKYNPPPAVHEVPLLFVNVNPDNATAEPPKDAKYYSSKNSRAANPEMDQDTGAPKINGQQTEIAKAEDTPRDRFDKLQPTRHPAEQEHPAEQAKPKPPVGDLAMVKPDLNPHPDTGTAEQTRPRTIKEALMRQRRDQLVGQKMKQNGGVNNQRIDPGFDVKATPFGDYDEQFIEIVQSHWYDLLDKISYNGYRPGKVELQFRLYYDGRITDMSVVDENVGATLSLLCQKAILDPAPFDAWSREMRLMVDKDYREFHFTFYY
jgi:hypothetical protein